MFSIYLNLFLKDFEEDDDLDYSEMTRVFLKTFTNYDNFINFFFLLETNDNGRKVSEAIT